MTKSEQVDKLFPALLEAQRLAKNPGKDAKNPHFGNRYASLAAVLEAALPVLNGQGLAVVQWVEGDETGPALHTLVAHESGQWMQLDPMYLPATKRDAQGFGSAVTYARRYSLQALVGITAEDDDDGEAAAGRAGEIRPAKNNFKAPARGK